MLPPEIGSFTWLQRLELRGNKLSSLPSEIGNLTQLKWLDLEDNQLTFLPSEIGNLTQLEWLDLEDNQLTFLPPEIGNLIWLELLFLEDNQLTSLPSQISNLTELTDLYINANPLMFIFKKDLTERKSCSSLDHSELMLKYLGSSNHFCRTPLATLCQGIHCGDDDIALQKKFNALSSEMQELIRSKWEAPLLSPFLPSSSADRALFNRAVISVLRDKFMALSLEQRSQMYDHVSKFAGQPQGGTNWGELHAKDNIIGLIDAMELATDQKILKRKYSEGGALIDGLSDGKDVAPAEEVGIQPSHYEIWDASLEAIWSKIELEVFTGGLPVEAAAIRGWLNDPANIKRITQIKFLDLSDLELEMLPPEIGRFTQLKKLELNGNKLSFLPSEIGNLTRLKWLDLKGNKLTSLPPQIGNLTRLKQLFLDDNQLTSLPSKFGNLTRLTYLNLCGNQLTSLPFKISNLTRLTRLYLHGNPLMFIFNRDWTEKPSYSSLDHSELMLKYLRSSNHFCRTPLATLCQGIHCGDDDIAIQKKFNALSSEMQELIRSKWEAPPLSPFLPSSSTDRALFNRALISMLRDKFMALSLEQRSQMYDHVSKFAGQPQGGTNWGKLHAEDNIMALSLEQRSQIYDHVSKFAGQPQGGSNWGKLHAEDNIIGLIDAMELATNQKNLKRKYNET